MLIALLAACAPMPDEASDLYGIWALRSGQDVAVLEFWEEREFAIYAYALSEGPYVVNTGDYAIQQGDLVLVADSEERFTYPLLAWDPQVSLQLEISGVSQTYEYVAELP